MDKIIHPVKDLFENATDYHLKPEHELRIHEIETFIRLRVTDGIAEVFGRELPLEETAYFFKGDNFAIFTWRGCKITIEGEYKRDYKCYEAPASLMRERINLNHILEQMRNVALSHKICGPRVFVTGNRESGKSSFCKTLVNYALKLGWSPILVDLNLTKNLISAPGCISAALIEEPLEGHTDDLTANSINYFHGACG